MLQSWRIELGSGQMMIVSLAGTRAEQYHARATLPPSPPHPPLHLPLHCLRPRPRPRSHLPLIRPKEHCRVPSWACFDSNKE